MTDKPLLIFPTPTLVGRYKRSLYNSSVFVKPSKEQQLQRIAPILQKIESDLKEKRIKMQAEIPGDEPEMVLVLETRGVVQEFFKAVRAIDELEWLGEWEKEFDPSDFFYFKDSNRQVVGKFFFILTNFAALQKILDLWKQYRLGRKFAKGTTKWRDLFELLLDIRPWGVSDRIDETGIREDIQFRIEHNQDTAPFELELWYRKTAGERLAAKGRIQFLVDQFDGEIIAESIIDSIGYHALLVKAPIQIFEHLNAQTDIEFFKSEDIMFFRPVGQCNIKNPQVEVIEELKIIDPAKNLETPIIGMLDGLPLQNHILLANRLLIDDPDNYSENYLAAARIHGTSMASIIIHDNLNNNNVPIRSKVYIRPITKPAYGDLELIPENVLVVDLMHRCVKRIFEGDGNERAVAPTIKVINISLGDPYRVLNHTMSSWAKILDWLSFKYNVLFIVSAGNCTDELDLTDFNGTLDALLADGETFKSEVIKGIYNNNRHRKVISPAEGINVLTVGASDHDTLTFQPPNGRVYIFQSPVFMSPVSRMGLGYRRSIKPEVFLPGGRTLYRQKVGEKKLAWVNSNGRLGVKVAAPLPNGSTVGSIYTAGTSNAAASMSHLAAKLHESFMDNGFDPALINSIFPLLAKSLLVHSASWDEMSANEIKSSINLANGNARDLVTRFLGYGHLKPEQVFSCTDKRVTLIGHGEVIAEQGHLFDLPLPVQLSGTTSWRSLTVTLSWFSPVNCDIQSYRQAKLWFDFPNKQLTELLSVTRKFYDDATVSRGTIQHEVFDGTKASAILEDSHLNIRVNCKEDASGLRMTPIKYVIAVTLEVAPNVAVDLYEHIKLRLRPRVLNP